LGDLENLLENRLAERSNFAWRGKHRPAVFVPVFGFGALVGVTVIRLAMGVPQASAFKTYAHAVEQWWAGIDPYGAGGHGFLYLPSSIVLFTPFASMGPKLGGVAWCLLSAGLYGSGLMRLARLVSPAQGLPVLAIALLATLPSLNRNLSDGQAQVIMTGLLLNAASDLIVQRNWRCAALLSLAFAIKPIAVPMVGLVFVLFSELRVPLLIGLCAVLLLPLIHPDSGFALAEYGNFIEKILVAGQVSAAAWPWLADISTLLAALGIPIGQTGQLAIRAVGAGLALYLGYRARNLSRVENICAVLALSLIYLTLLNPRTEFDAYVALSSVIGISAGAVLSRTRSSVLGWALLGAALALGIPWGKQIDPWLKPALALLYAVYWSWILFAAMPEVGPSFKTRPMTRSPG
jgi:alpha-1,2-mannosyltransferase